jgi:chemotaxis protein methyltransferase CheR
MDLQHLEQFQKLVASRLGLHVREQERELLQKTLLARIQALKFESNDKYFQFLSDGTSQSDNEWKQLSILLTNQESYFFRDQGQFDLLRRHILPQLIERNRVQRTLRLWSAGCSTGQEPYSLAILVDQLLTPHHDWKVLVLGTDLSEAALEKARRGVFGAWSFRTLDPEIQERYFQRRQNEYEIDERIRRSVTFQYGNLLQDSFPLQSSGIYELDLILCRNVFIYFKRDAVETVLRKFERTLTENSYLVTGHAELHDCPLGLLRAHTFPQSVVYQRSSQPAPTSRATLPARPLAAPDNSTTRPARSALLIPPARPTLPQIPSPPLPSPPLPSPPLPSPPLPSPPLPSPPLRPNAAKPASMQTPAPKPGDAEATMQEAMRALRMGNTMKCLSVLEPWLKDDTLFAAQCLAAQAHANAGRLEAARQFAQRAAKLEPFAPLPLHILARIAEEDGDRETAKVLLKKVMYLSPSLVVPYLELSAIYEHEGDGARARKMRETALELIQPLTDDAPVPTDPLSVENALSAGQLRRHLGHEKAS